MTDFSKCAFIDAFILPNHLRTNKETTEQYKDFSANVFISYKDENGETKISEFAPVYEYFIPVNNYFTYKDLYDSKTKKDPSWIDEFNKTQPEEEKIYLGIDGTICRKRVCASFKEFDEETHGYRVPKPISPEKQKWLSKIKNKEANSEYGTSVSTVMKNIDQVNEIRKREGLFEYKVKWLLYESSHNVAFKTIIRNFSSSKDEVKLLQPNLKVCFFDIEVDMRTNEEFPNPKKAQLPINAISMYNCWENKNITIGLCPNRPYENIAPMTIDEARELCKDIPDTIIVETEEELLELMLQNFEKCDVISGYNSAMFDLPYIINRIKRVLGSKATHRLNMIDCEPIIITKSDKEGQKTQQYQLIGRIHVDYLLLYKHHTPKQQPSYKLDFIGKLETGIGKEEYEGNLEQLYHRDFRKFIEYNRQDAALLKAIDDKVKFIELTNALAHTHGVTFDAMQGTVSWVDQWQINNAHTKGKVCPDSLMTKEKYEKNKLKTDLEKYYLIFKKSRVIANSNYTLEDIQYHPNSPLSKYYDWNDYGAPGAWVNMPMRGVAFFMSSYDINSLYPSIIRSLNIGIESIVGRVRQNYTAKYMINKCITNNVWGKVKDKIPNYTELWLHEWAIQEMKLIWDETDDPITIDFENGLTETRTAKEWKKIIFEDHKGEWCISANGTIFDTTVQSITAWTMEKGYAERKGFQKIMRMYEDCHDSIGISPELENELFQYISNLDRSTVGTTKFKDVQTVAGKDYETPYLFDVATLRTLVKENRIDELKEFIRDNDLTIKNHKIMSNYDDNIVELTGYWNLRQKIYKISINSTYGALLTAGSKWYDVDQGRSITLTGQNITRHMTSFAIKEMTGDYDYLNNGVCIGDTDSCYISISKALATKDKEYNMSIEELVDYADEVGDKVNASFPEFMHKTFGVDLDHGAIIKAGRENVFYSCLCIVKKHYAGLVVNSDGHYIFSRVGITIPDEEIKKKYLDLGIIDGVHYVHAPKGIVYKEIDKQYYAMGKLKITGLDELRSDVSPEVKTLLRKILCIILLGGSKNVVEDLVIDEYNRLMAQLPWQKGMPKSCRNLSDWEEKIGIFNGDYKNSNVNTISLEPSDDSESEKFGNITIPANASACINWNRLRLIHNDLQSPQLMNGHRIIFLKVKYPNHYKIKNIALPYDIDVIPEWFKELPFDEETMVQATLLKKVENLTAPMGWKFDMHKNAWSEQFGDLFSME